MKTTTLTFTLEVEDHINPLFLIDAAIETFELCGAEVIGDKATNVTKEDNLNWESVHF